MTDELEAVRQAAEQLDQHRNRLHAAIKAASAAGYKLRPIADAARLSHQTIANILRSQP